MCPKPDTLKLNLEVLWQLEAEFLGALYDMGQNLPTYQKESEVQGY